MRNATDWGTVALAANHSLSTPPTSSGFEHVKLVTLAVIIVWTVAANILVFMVLWRNPRLQTVPNLLVANLAFSDLALGIVVLPFSALYTVNGEWQFGRMTCECWLSADMFCCTASIWNLSIVGLDRYWAITKPTQYLSKRNKRTAALLIAGVWLLAALITLPPFFGLRNVASRGNYYIEGGVFQCGFIDLPAYTVYSATGSFFVPCILMYYVYYKIYTAFSDHKARQAFRQNVIKQHIESTLMCEIKPASATPPLPGIAGSRQQYLKMVHGLPAKSQPTPPPAIKNVRQRLVQQQDRQSAGALRRKATMLTSRGYGNPRKSPDEPAAQRTYSYRRSARPAPTPAQLSAQHVPTLTVSDDRTSTTCVRISDGTTAAAGTQRPGSDEALSPSQTTPPPAQQLSADSDSPLVTTPVPLFRKRADMHGSDKRKTSAKSVYSGRSSSSKSHKSRMQRMTSDVAQKVRKKSSKIQASVRKRRQGAGRRDGRQFSAAKERRGVRVLGIILGCFAMCWTPFFVMYLLREFCARCVPNMHIEQFITWLGYSNSAMNPIIYTIFNREYQIALKRLFTPSRRESVGAPRRNAIAL